MVKLYTDCKTDAERASFFRSGRGWESGIVAKSLERDLADVFAFRAAVAAALAALEEELRVKAMATVADGKFSKIGHGINIARIELKATIAALNLTHTEGQ